MRHIYTSCGILGINAQKKKIEDVCGKGTFFDDVHQQCLPKNDVCMEGFHINKTNGKCEEDFQITHAFDKMDKNCKKNYSSYEKDLGPSIYKNSPIVCAEACAKNSDCISFLTTQHKVSFDGEHYDGLCAYFTESIGNCKLKDLSTTEAWTKKLNINDN